MRLLLIVAILLPSIALGATDKQRHFGYSAALSVIGYTGCKVLKKSPKKSIYCALFLSLGLGFLKETMDDKFDMEDMSYNLGGATAGITIPLLIESF